MALDIKIEKRKLNIHEHKKEVFVAVPDRNGGGNGDDNTNFD